MVIGGESTEQPQVKENLQVQCLCCEQVLEIEVQLSLARSTLVVCPGCQGEIYIGKVKVEEASRHE